MKQALKFIAVAAAVALTAGQASAAIISNVSFINGSAAMYLGTLNPVGSMGSPDRSFFDNGTLTGSFVNNFVLDFGPGPGSMTTNANFLPSTDITGFQVNFFSAAGALCPMAIGSVCTTIGAPTFLFAGSPGNNSEIGFQGLTPGRYLIAVSGSVVAGRTPLYSGQVLTRAVPEPGSLALVGAALLGLAFTARKRKQG